MTGQWQGPTPEGCPSKEVFVKGELTVYSKCVSNPLEKKKIAQSNSWKDSERKKSCQMMIAHFWSVKLKNNNKTNIRMKLTYSPFLHQP